MLWNSQLPTSMWMLFSIHLPFLHASQKKEIQTGKGFETFKYNYAVNILLLFYSLNQMNDGFCWKCWMFNRNNWENKVLIMCPFEWLHHITFHRRSCLVFNVSVLITLLFLCSKLFWQPSHITFEMIYDANEIEMMLISMRNGKRMEHL